MLSFLLGLEYHVVLIVTYYINLKKCCIYKIDFFKHTSNLKEVLNTTFTETSGIASEY